MAIMKKLKAMFIFFQIGQKKYESVIYDGAMLSQKDAQIFFDKLSKVEELPLFVLMNICNKG